MELWTEVRKSGNNIFLSVWRKQRWSWRILMDLNGWLTTPTGIVVSKGYPSPNGWLVVWNHGICHDFPIIFGMECHHPTDFHSIFQRGGSTTNQKRWRYCDYRLRRSTEHPRRLWDAQAGVPTPAGATLGEMYHETWGKNMEKHIEIGEVEVNDDFVRRGLKMKQFFCVSYSK